MPTTYTPSPKRPKRSTYNNDEEPKYELRRGRACLPVYYHHATYLVSTLSTLALYDPRLEAKLEESLGACWFLREKDSVDITYTMGYKYRSEAPNANPLSEEHEPEFRWAKIVA